MSRHGQCRCGAVLTFRRGSQGYKTRCPHCGSVVRLQAQHKLPAPHGRTVQCPCGTVLSATGGTKIVCPSCSRSVSVAEPEQPAYTLPAPMPSPAARDVPHVGTRPTPHLDAIELEPLPGPLPSTRGLLLTGLLIGGGILLALGGVAVLVWILSS